MNDRSNSHLAEQLFDYAGRRAAGGTPQPRNELEAVADRVFDALGSERTTGIPSSVRVMVRGSLQAYRPAPAAVPQRGRLNPRGVGMWLSVAAMVTLIIASSIGVIWREQNEKPDQTPTSYVLAAPTQPSASTASPRPIPTKTPFTTCDMRQDVPYFYGEPDTSVTGTLMYLNGDNQLWIRCREEQTDVLMAEHVMVVQQTRHPNIVSLLIEDPSSPPSQVYRDITTTDYLEPGGNTGAEFQGVHQTDGTSWTLSRLDSGWQLISLSRFEKRMLSDLGGIDWLADTVAVTTSEESGAIALAPGKNPGETVDGTGEIAPNPKAPGSVLIVNDDFSYRWLSFPQGLTDPAEMRFSPNGRFLAIKTTSGRIWIIDAQSGNVISKTDPLTPGEWKWLRTSSSIVVGNGGSVIALDATPGASQRSLVQGRVDIGDLYYTPDANVIVAFPKKSGAGTPDVTEQIHVINIGSGRVHTVEGTPWGPSGPSAYADPDALGVFGVVPPGDATKTIHVFDATNGRELTTLPFDSNDLPMTRDHSGPYYASSTDGNVTSFFVQRESAVIATRQNGATKVSVVPLPNPDSVGADSTLQVAPDGSLVTFIDYPMTGNDRSYVIDPWDTGSGWAATGEAVRLGGFISHRRR